MSVLQRVRTVGNERLDRPDFLNLDAFANADWTQFVDKFLSDSSVIVSGFDISNPGSLVGTSATSVNITIADSVMFHPTSAGAAGGFFVAPSTSAAQNIILVSGQTNYIEMDQSISTGSPDTRAIWDETGGADGTGAEFTQTIDTVTNLEVTVTSNTASFTPGSVPICQVAVNANGSITSITDCRNLMFRLGSGGASPDPFNKFAWPSLPDAAAARTDEPTVLTTSSPAGSNPFQGSDKNITSMKGWMDAVMSRIAEIQGNQFWFTPAGAIANVNLADMFWDSLGSMMTDDGTGGSFAWNSDTSQLSWTTDVEIKSLFGPYKFVIDSTRSPITLATGQVAYVTQIRRKIENDVPTGNSGANWTFTNLASYVDGPAAGAFTGLESNVSNAKGIGDWIKKSGDGYDKYVQIADFKDGPNGTGASTTAGNAISVTTVEPYQGTSDTVPAAYAKGEYAVSVNDLIDVPADGDTWWLAYRHQSGTRIYVRNAGEMENGEEREINDNQSDEDIQDKNLKLVTKTPVTLAANFDWNGTTLKWEQLYLAGANQSSELLNKITDNAGGVTMSDGDVLYVSFNKSGTPPLSITMTKVANSSLDVNTLSDNTLIVARRIGNDIYTFE